MFSSHLALRDPHCAETGVSTAHGVVGGVGGWVVFCICVAGVPVTGQTKGDVFQTYCVVSLLQLRVCSVQPPLAALAAA